MCPGREAHNQQLRVRITKAWHGLAPICPIEIGAPFFPRYSLAMFHQARLVEHLGVERLHAVVGGSIGGMQALSWAVQWPGRLTHCVVIGASPLSAMGLAVSHLQRQAIRHDPRLQKFLEWSILPQAGIARQRCSVRVAWSSVLSGWLLPRNKRSTNGMSWS